MTTFYLLLGACVLFLIALRMSAFFSGSETGFYRLSRLRLGIDARSGDATANRLHWFSQRPQRFVAMALVGNNIANYFATLAIGMISVCIIPESTGKTEIILTLVTAPLIFVWGELIPKSIYYRAPMHFLGKHATSLTVWYFLLAPVAAPLALISRIVERFSSGQKQPLELLLGRNRLIHVMNQGHQAGLLSDVQSRLIENVMRLSVGSAESSSRIDESLLVVSEAASDEEVAELAKASSASLLLIHRDREPREFEAWAPMNAIRIGRRASEQRRVLPEFAADCCALEAFRELRSAESPLGLTRSEDGSVGIITEQELVKQLFASPG